jgi:hypothetical protein
MMPHEILDAIVRWRAAAARESETATVTETERE